MRGSAGNPAEAALEYARRGLPVFPCIPRGKNPLTDHGYLDATTDADQVEEWWRRHPRANIGGVPGGAGLLVLDVDGPEGERAAQGLGVLAEPTLTVQTARGLHLYYLHPGGHVGNRRLAAGLDVRADGGYVLLPPSLHPSGARYTWLRRCDPLPLPPAVGEALRPPMRATAWGDATPLIEAGTARRRAYVAAAIEAECLDLARTSEGNRNNRLNEAAFSLARFVETREVARYWGARGVARFGGGWAELGAAVF